MMRFLNNPKLEVDGCYTEWSAYGNAKVSNLLFAREAHKRYGGKGVSAYSLHPGGIHTGLQGHVDAWTMFKWRVVTPFFFKSIAQGAATSIYCATQPGIETEGGEYFDDCKANPKVGARYDETLGKDAGARLWAATEALCKR